MAIRVLVNSSIVHLDIDARFDERLHIGALESIQVARADFDGPIASHELVTKVNAHLWDAVVSSQYQGPNKVIPAIAARLKAGNLRASEDDRLAQMLQHE